MKTSAGGRTAAGSSLAAAWPLAVVLMTFLSPTATAFDEEKNWYTRYPAYPPYCSTPDEMATRGIPPLDVDGGGNSSLKLGDSSLRHVTVLLRHGARTPWGNTLNCWDDYWSNPETGVWDCNLTAWLSPPPPERVTEEGAEAGNDEAMFLFEKRYDALNFPSGNLSNFLNGTCQKGQLLLQGYKQELQNGKFLRDAYIHDNSNENTPRLTLLDVRPGRGYLKNGPWQAVYYRVDDEARTLMSGQVILRGLFGKEMDHYYEKKSKYPVIPLHTADYKRDIISTNENICPRLKEMREDMENSTEYAAKFKESEEAKTLIDFTRTVLQLPDQTQDMHAIDCLMTTMCTDRPLPDAVNDYQPSNRREEQEIQVEQPEGSGDYGPNLFNRLMDLDVEKYTHVSKANDSEYAKLAMAPLWHEILDKLEPHLSSDDASPKLAVYSGHDTTIIHLLASLGQNVWGDKDWPPYASMIAIEIHEFKQDTDKFPTGFAFRLIFNGEAITSLIDGCRADMDVCDVTVLLNRVKSFASNLDNRDCSPKKQAPPEEETTEEETTEEGALDLANLDLDIFRSITPDDEMDYMKSEGKHIIATPEGIVALVFICLLCFILGSMFSCFCCKLCCRVRRRPRGSQLVATDDNCDDLALTTTGESSYHDNAEESNFDNDGQTKSYTDDYGATEAGRGYRGKGYRDPPGFNNRIS
ncbi:Lysosomal acid phosphatase [Seminavis robusta]|uniref:Lysosomal acid phosphatase n=1 Tax=Seminavis robusta TaxID=568900 RepID=A0A9N8EZX6_9STRA|nr:Lysosomal acid phosphatase [Seminavis robusta]|eukprot:Sro2691_g334770.1 Lysosomal acid phosphatase (695) ;mRNA; f:3618-5702